MGTICDPGRKYNVRRRLCNLEQFNDERPRNGWLYLFKALDALDRVVSIHHRISRRLMNNVMLLILRRTIHSFAKRGYLHFPHANA